MYVTTIYITKNESNTMRPVMQYALNCRPLTVHTVLHDKYIQIAYTFETTAIIIIAHNHHHHHQFALACVVLNFVRVSHNTHHQESHPITYTICYIYSQHNKRGCSTSMLNLPEIGEGAAHHEKRQGTE